MTSSFAIEDWGARNNLYPGFLMEANAIEILEKSFFFLISFSVERLAMFDNFSLSNNDLKQFLVNLSEIIINSILVLRKYLKLK